MSKELSQRLRAMVSQDGRCISFTGRTSTAMCQDILAAAEALSHLPDREEVARVLAEEFGTHAWDDMASTQRELKIWYRNSAAYDINDVTRDDCYIAADRILSLMERKA